MYEMIRKISSTGKFLQFTSDLFKVQNIVHQLFAVKSVKISGTKFAIKNMDTDDRCGSYTVSFELKMSERLNYAAGLTKTMELRDEISMFYLLELTGKLKLNELSLSVQILPKENKEGRTYEFESYKVGIDIPIQ